MVTSLTIANKKLLNTLKLLDYNHHIFLVDNIILGLFIKLYLS